MPVDDLAAEESPRDMTRDRVSLVEVVPELADRLSGAALEDASHTVLLKTVRVEPGEFCLPEIYAQAGAQPPVVGAVVVGGLVSSAMDLGGRTCTRLHGPGDLLSIPEASDLLPATATQVAGDGVTLATLDRSFAIAQTRWPALGLALLEHALIQGQRGMLQQAISQLPRVEDRLMATLSVLAERWGRVGPQGVVVELPLTHELLGRMVGSRRSTVTIGLRALVEDGSLRLDDGRWVLAGAGR